MNMTSRERRLLIATMVIVVGAAAANYVVLPAIDYRTSLAEQELLLSQKATQQANLIDADPRVQTRLRELRKQGMLNSGEKAEKALLEAINRWSGRARLNVPSVQPLRQKVEEGIGKVTVRVSGEGRVDAVIGFLREVESTQQPVRIDRMTLTGMDDAGRSVSIDMQISTIFSVREQKTSSRREGA